MDLQQLAGLTKEEVSNEVDTKEKLLTAEDAHTKKRMEVEEVNYFCSHFHFNDYYFYQQAKRVRSYTFFSQKKDNITVVIPAQKTEIFNPPFVKCCNSGVEELTAESMTFEQQIPEKAPAEKVRNSHNI